MALSTIANGTREVKRPDKQTANLVLTRTAQSDVSQPQLDDWSVEGYSSAFGGQLLSSPDVSVSTTERQDAGSMYYTDIEFTVETDTESAGSDFVFEYTVSDDNAMETANFFYQNGVYPASIASGDFKFRVSAELERLSDTYDDGQVADKLTDFSDTSRWGVSDLKYVRQSSRFTKHGGEPIPYFAGPGEIELPEQAFSSRDCSIILALSWDHKQAEDFDVATVEQGGNTYLNVRNAQSDVEIQSDFTANVLYQSATHSGERLVAEIRINTGENEANGSVNREITDSGQSLQGTFSSGDTTITLHANSAKLFDALVYSEDVGSESLDRLAKQLSYFYKIDMTSPEFLGKGSRAIQNHLFYDEEIQKYDMYVASSPVKRFDDDGTEVWSFSADATAVATDSRFIPAVGTSVNNNVHRVTSKGNVIWTFEGHNESVEAVETGIEKFTYSASLDGTVKKLGPEGTPVWNFGDHTDDVNDIAVYKKLAVYTASADKTVRRIVDSTGDEDWSFSGHLDAVTSVVVDSSEEVYTAAVNGELRKIDNDGNETYLITPFSAELSGAAINDLALRSDTELYAVAGDMIKKLDAVNGDEIWKYQVDLASDTAKLEAVAVSPSGSIFVAENEENNIIEFDDTGSKVDKFSSPGTVNDISVQPGTFEPHRT